MLDRIINFSIKNKLVIGLFVVGLIAWGSYSFTQLPIDAVPDITNNQVQVITVTPSLAAQEVERLITFPVEITMATIPDIEEIRSFSRFGLSVVTIVFKEDVDVYWARQQVNERITKAKEQIPAGVGTPELAPVTTGLGEIYQYVVHTKKGYEDKYSPTELRTIQDWIIKRQLLGTEGVADVSSFGGYLKQYEIAIDPLKLRSMEISIAEVFAALQKNNQNTGGAYIDKTPNAYFIRSEGLVESIKDIENIVVKNTAEGTPILIRNLATVQQGHAIRYGATTRNGEGEVVSAIVMMLKGANSAKVIENVKERIEQIKKTLPEGVVIEPFLDRSKLVNSAIGTVSKNLIEGALIVIFILILLLGNMRAGLIVASVIPLAMLFAVSMMNLFGVSGNLMSLGAIDFGLIVDGAVIIVESIVHRIALANGGIKRFTQPQMDEEVYKASSKIRSSAAFGEIIILIVYLPILALVGIEGKMFRPMAQTVSFAILGAFILSLTYVPMISALVLSKKTGHKKNISDRIVGFFQKLYQPVILQALKHKVIVITTAFVLFVASLFIFSQLGGEFIPSLDEGDFAVETRLLPGSSLTETVNVSLKAQKILQEQFPEVEQTIGKIGSGEIPTDPMPVEACDLMVILKDKDEWTSAKTKDELADKMNKALSVIPGVNFGFLQPIQMRFNELMTGARQDVVVKIYGEDLDKLSNYAREVGKLVNSVEGAEDLYVEQVNGLPQINIVINRDALAKYGLSVEQVNTVVESAFAGKAAGIVYEGERRFDMVVRLDKDYRKEVNDVSGVYVTTADGHQIPLDQVADIRFEEGPNQIQRDDTKRRISIGFNVRNRDVESIVEEIKAKTESNIQFEPGYYATYGGQFQNLVEARQRLSIAVPVALLLIFVLLFFTFKSVKQSLLIFTAIPLSAIGGVLALYLRDMPFSISAGVGFIALFGVAVLNGIVLIAEFNHLKKQGIADIKERVLKGTEVRLRPVLMTALVASFGFLPMALSNSSGAEVQRPLATVVIGGLFTATLLTLIVLPVLYVYFEKGLKRTKIPTALIAIIAVAVPVLGNAQNVQPLSLEEAINTALKNHPTIQTAQLEINLEEKIKKTATDIGKTNLNWQHGQYNSIINSDNYFSISQNFAFPTVYAKKANLGKANIQSSEIKKQVTENQLTAKVKQTYYQLQYLAEYKAILKSLDSIYGAFSEASIARHKSGETNLLERNTATTRYMEIKNRLRIVEVDEKAAIQELKILMNVSDTVVFNLVSQPVKNTTEMFDTAKYKSNPALSYFRQQIEVEQQKYEVEKAAMLPEFSVGYFNQSLIGNQTVDGQQQYFGAEKRFTGFNVGIALPLWYKPLHAKKKAAQVKTEIAKSKYSEQENVLKSQYMQAVQQFIRSKNNLEYYEESALPQAKQMQTNAQQLFAGGAIGYVEYAQALNQSMQIQLNWLEALNNYNQAVIQLEYLSGVR